MSEEFEQRIKDGTFDLNPVCDACGGHARLTQWAIASVVPQAGELWKLQCLSGRGCAEMNFLAPFRRKWPFPVMEYVIVSRTSRGELEKAVSGALDQGWVLSGGVTCATFYKPGYGHEEIWGQAMRRTPGFSQP